MRIASHDYRIRKLRHTLQGFPKILETLRVTESNLKSMIAAKPEVRTYDCWLEYVSKTISEAEGE